MSEAKEGRDYKVIKEVTTGNEDVASSENEEVSEKKGFIKKVKEFPWKTVGLITLSALGGVAIGMVKGKAKRSLYNVSFYKGCNYDDDSAEECTIQEFTEDDEVTDIVVDDIVSVEEVSKESE